jgi:ferredoxin hydrogenase small subunit/hydrogenase small subunit
MKSTNDFEWAGAVPAGMRRRDFVKFCGLVAGAMGLGPVFGPEVARALTAEDRPSVVWLHGAECTGCTEALLRSVDPGFGELVLEMLSVEYHESVMAASGHAAEALLRRTVESGRGYVCVIEGAVPTNQGGLHGKVGGRTMLSVFSEVASRARAVIALGSCASFGGVQAAAPNPSGAKGVAEALAPVGVEPLNIAGCPPNPVNLVGTVVHLLTKGLPKVDSQGRPRMFYGRTVHDHCQRRPHFDAGRFAPSFASKEAGKGWCLYELGCKGPYTRNNCPTEQFNQANWPVRAGAPCIGCSEPNFWDDLSPFDETVIEKGRG